MKKVSVIVPMFNSEKFINSTIKCLKLQTLSDIEFIIIDDGSTDNSNKICNDEIKNDKRFKLIYQKNSGVSAARNTGLSVSTGEYLLFLDSDDLFDADMCEKMYKCAKTYDADMVIFGIKIREFDGTEKLMNGTGNVEVWNGNTALSNFYNRKKINVGVHTKLFKRDILKNLKFEVGRKINEDKFFLFQGIINSSTIVYNDICKYTYIRRKGSASNTEYLPKYNDINYFSKKILSIIEKDYSIYYLNAYADYVKNLLFVFRKLCKNKKNIIKYHNEYLELKNEIMEVKLLKLKKVDFINLCEVLFIKIFGNLYFKIVSLLYNRKGNKDEK